MTQPTSRATLKDYAKRQLGHPVVELNLDDDQMEDRIDDALEFFQEYHFDATEPTFLKHQITASTLKLTANVVFTAGETITGGTSGVRATVHEYHSANTTIRYKNPEVKSGGDGNTFYGNTTTTTHASTANSLGDFDNQYISITENIIGVKGVIPFYRETEGNTNMFSVNYQYALNDLYRMGTGAQMSNYVFTQQHLTTINNLFNTMPRFRFNRHTDRLYLDVRWGDDVKIDDFIVAECYTITDPSSFSDVYGDMFLKKYVTSLFKKQWGQNLIKFEGLQLPGGVTLNGRQLYDDAVQELDKIEEEVQLKYQLPDDFMIG